MGLKKAVTKKAKQTVKKKVTKPIKKKIRKAVSSYCSTCQRNQPPGHTCRVRLTAKNAARRRQAGS